MSLPRLPLLPSWAARLLSAAFAVAAVAAVVWSTPVVFLACTTAALAASVADREPE